MTFFHDTRQDSEELRQVSIGLHVSNVASRSVQVSKAWLHYKACIVISKKQEGDIQIYNPNPEGGLGYDPIVPADQMRPATGRWIISPDREKERMGVRVRLIDQFGNECWSERITLFPMTDPRRMR
jgi:hypothetical protein